jgi:hypothetical protein
MRLLMVVWLLASCVPEQLPAHRPMVVDAIPYGANRAEIRAWHLAHGWCIRRVWPTTDEFVRCDLRPEANPTFPAVFSMIRYDAAGWSISYAVFAPVQHIFNFMPFERLLDPDHELVDPAEGLYLDLADRGRAIERPRANPRLRTRRLFAALADELDQRCGKPTWKSAWGETWQTKRTELGLFVASNGHWIIETHEVKPQYFSAFHWVALTR